MITTNKTIIAATIIRVRDGWARPSFPAAIPLLRERIDSFGEGEIEFGQSTLTVGGKHQAHFVVANIDVGMMLLILGHLGDAVDEVDRFRKLIKLERPFDMLLFELPFRDLFQAVLQLVRFD